MSSATTGPLDTVKTLTAAIDSVAAGTKPNGSAAADAPTPAAANSTAATAPTAPGDIKDAKSTPTTATTNTGSGGSGGSSGDATAPGAVGALVSATDRSDREPIAGVTVPDSANPTLINNKVYGPNRVITEEERNRNASGGFYDEVEIEDMVSADHTLHASVSCRSHLLSWCVDRNMTLKKRRIISPARVVTGSLSQRLNCAMEKRWRAVRRVRSNYE